MNQSIQSIISISLLFFKLWVKILNWLGVRYCISDWRNRFWSQVSTLLRLVWTSLQISEQILWITLYSLLHAGYPREFECYLIPATWEVVSKSKLDRILVFLLNFRSTFKERELNNILRFKIHRLKSKITNAIIIKEVSNSCLFAFHILSKIFNMLVSFDKIFFESAPPLPSLIKSAIKWSNLLQNSHKRPRARSAFSWHPFFFLSFFWSLISRPPS